MNERQFTAFTKRDIANRIAQQRPQPRHLDNGDEQKFRHTEDTAQKHEHSLTQFGIDTKVANKPTYLMSFTKGMPHNPKTGLLDNPDDFQKFVRAIDSGDPRDFRDTPLGHPKNCLGYQCSNNAFGWQSAKAQTGKAGGPVDVRAWESQGAGLTFDLEGPDAQAVTIPPAPRLGSPELLAEMAEVYAQALLRDVPLNALSAGADKNIPGRLKLLETKKADFETFESFTDFLNDLEWFDPAVELDLTEEERIRRRTALQTPANAFRGTTPGDDLGPYLSQFLLVGNGGVNANDDERTAADGLITYGAISIDQRVRVAKEVDYMTTWNEWLDVQNGADLRALEAYEEKPTRRFI
ncbi:MAG: bromoperoxidase, partial [Bacteroidota bacterium]